MKIVFIGFEICRNSPPAAVNECLSVQFQDECGEEYHAPGGIGMGFYPREPISDTIRKLQVIVDGLKEIENLNA